MDHDTIAAIGTAMSHSGIGIVRISGEDAIAIADRIFVAKKQGKKLKNVATHTLHYGHIVKNEQIIDEVLVSVMRGPRSYTAEDVVEINCHGGILVMKKILDTVIENGARPAEAGEFTKRAFLNGRMDLSQAEAVIDIINSQNDFALKSAVKQLSGSVSEKIKSIRSQLIYEMAYIESALDDPEHYPMDNYGEELSIKLKPLINEIERLANTADDGRILKEGIKTVILGKPNAGKSSLLNLMVGSERAIVTDIEGTTRDTLEEHILLDGISLNIVDTAGIRKTSDVVEKIGVERAKNQAEEADLVLYVIDATKPLDDNDREIIQCISGKKSIVLFNKCDLDTVLAEQEIRQMMPEQSVIVFSARERTGFDILKDRIKEMFYSEELKFNDEIYLTSARHKAALDSAYRSLNLVLDSIEAGMPEDFFTIDMMSAYDQLGYITGESVEDDLVNEIFSKFCMGK
jgi:tRNA modification GTPase